MKINLSLIIALILTACSGPSPIDKSPNSPSPTPSPTAGPVSYSGWGVQYSSAGETASKLTSVSLSLSSKTKAVTRIKHDRTSRGVMIGTNGTMVSISADGKRLTEMNSPTTLNIRDVAINGSKTWVVGRDSSGGESVWVSTNGGQTWSKDFNTSDFYFAGDNFDAELDRLTGIVSISSNEVMVSGTLRDGFQILLKRDVLGSWADLFIDPAISVTRLTSIAKTDIDSYVVTGNNGLVGVSFDAGDTWNTTQLQTDTDISKVSCADIVCFVAGDSGLLFLSNDGGSTWEQSSTPTGSNITAVSVTTTETAYRVYVGDSTGSIFYSDDLGLNWTAQTKKTNLPVLDIFMISESSGWASSGLQTGTSGSLLFQEKL